MLKILIIGNGAIGNINGKYSVNKHTAQFCKELLDSGHDVGFLQFEEIILENAGLQDFTLDKSIEIHTMPSKKGKRKILSYLSMVRLMLTTLQKYDFIYIFYPGHVPTLASLISIMLRKKYGLYIRGQHNLDTTVGKYIIKKAKFCLTVSNLLKEKLFENNQDSAVIAPMIDFSKKDILLDREYSNDGITRCLFVGRVELRKGIFDLMKAIEILSKKHDFIHFDIVGGGDSFEMLNEKMNAYKNITFHGQVSKKEALLAMYRQADLFIFPSHDEGFPRVLYEAMMARTPVITTMVGGIGGFMKDHHNCIAIEPENQASIVSVVEEMLSSDAVRMKLTEQATRDVLKLFDGTRKKHSELLLSKIERLT